MKTTFYYCLLVLLLIISGCTSDKGVNTVEVKSVSIDPDKYDHFIDLSSCLEDSINFICLQSTDDCLLSQIMKIKVRDDRIFISDNLNSGVFIFDTNGKFIKKIGKIGEGPGEFRYMQDFWVINRDSICIHDLHGFKNITYDINTGTFSEAMYEKGVYHLETIKFDNIYYYVSNYFRSEFGCYNLYRINQINEIQPLISFDEKISIKITWINANYSSKHKDKSLLMYPMNDTIYEITKQTVKPCYKVSFSKRHIPDELFKSNRADIFVSHRRDKFIIGFDYFQNSEEYILARYVDNNMFRYLMLNKETLDYKIGESLIISKFGNVSFYDYYTGENDELITYLDAENFKNNWEVNYKIGEFQNPGVKKEFESVARKIQGEDNPVILMFKFKKKSVVDVI